MDDQKTKTQIPAPGLTLVTLVGLDGRCTHLSVASWTFHTFGMFSVIYPVDGLQEYFNLATLARVVIGQHCGASNGPGRKAKAK